MSDYDGPTPEEERQQWEMEVEEAIVDKINAVVPRSLDADTMGAIVKLIVQERDAAKSRAADDLTNRLYRDIDTIEIALKSLLAFQHLRQHHPSALRGNNHGPEEYDMVAKALKVINEARARDDRIPF